MKKTSIVGGGLHFGINTLTQPFFALYAAQLGASTASIGGMLTLKAVLPLLIALPAGQLIDRLGAPQLMRWGNRITILSLALMVWSPNLLLLTLSQLLIGAGTMIVASSLQVIVSEGDKAERERNITRYSAWCSGGSMVGPLVGGAAVSAVSALRLEGWLGALTDGYRTAFLIALFAALLFGALFRWASRHVRPDPGFGAQLRTVFQPREIADSYLKGIHLVRSPGIQFGLLGTFLIHFIQSIWIGFFPLYLDMLGYSAFVISVLVSLRGLAGMVSRMFIGRLTRRWSHQALLIGAGCAAAVCLLLLPGMGWHAAAVGAVSLLIGAAVGINMPVSTMIMVEDAMGDRGKIMGLRLLANRSSQVAAPMLFGLVGQLLGLAAAFYAGGAMLLAAMLGFSVYHRTRGAAVAIKQRVEVEK
ncbi:MFS transporter [Paenibacillus sp. IB182496]|uniref:MFS transporter n=1 Tax=Paenibacillus sabuli TaxID=2772509 RepID=A0A927BQR3_9BACL|nr:MFS transporter [Paenibacillus sabuli]MBD2843758.1 MFS transporter [Paenibacillus sabuli]